MKKKFWKKKKKESITNKKRFTEFIIHTIQPSFPNVLHYRLTSLFRLNTKCIFQSSDPVQNPVMAPLLLMKLTFIALAFLSVSTLWPQFVFPLKFLIFTIQTYALILLDISSFLKQALHWSWTISNVIFSVKLLWSLQIRDWPFIWTSVVFCTSHVASITYSVVLLSVSILSLWLYLNHLKGRIWVHFS